jgi:Putative salt-induced outer membrane protein
MFFAAQGDFDLKDRLYGFVRGSWERDEFSGYESRAFLGAGLGYHVLKEAPTTWALEVAPGQKFDEVREVILPGPVIVPGYSDNAFSVIGVSRVAHQFNPAVKLSNDTFVTWSDLTTQIDNRLAVSAALTGALSARFSFDVRHETNPPIGFEATDTATRVSLVYAFGN